MLAGVGGIRRGFTEAFGSKMEVVFSSEIDKNTQKTYYLNFNELPHGDITTIDEQDIPKHDIILAGFPCQAFSIAGHRKGFFSFPSVLGGIRIRELQLPNKEYQIPIEE